MNNEQAKCELCGEPMPEGEEMFVYHGYSGPCPNPPLPPQEEPWVSIEGVLCDIEAKVIGVAEGMKLIRGYLETTSPPQPDQFSQTAKKVPEPWVREFDDLMLVRFVSDSITLDYYGVQKIKAFIQKTLEADREERAGGGGNVMK